MTAAFFAPYLKQWDLCVDGEPILTPTSRLLPVLFDGRPAMLKVATHEEERNGADLMVWFAGDGAARALAHRDDAVLLERAIPGTPLAALVADGRDDEASQILCDVIARLHQPRATAPPVSLIPLTTWFEELFAMTGRNDLFKRGADTAIALLAAPHDHRPLHGDMHHENVLDFGDRGWLAIDPKGLLGDRYFDYANLFCNPDHENAAAAGCLRRRLSIVCKCANLEPKRMLEWILVWGCLSATWHTNSGTDGALPLAVAECAAAELDT